LSTRLDQFASCLQVNAMCAHCHFNPDPSASTLQVLASQHQAPRLSFCFVVQVKAMYAHCGFDPDPSASTLQMLANIEARLEDVLRAARKLPGEVWEAAEKGRERERRGEARDAKVQATKEVRVSFDWGPSFVCASCRARCGRLRTSAASASGGCAKRSSAQRHASSRSTASLVGVSPVQS
jgi:hypothetical protein